MNKTFLIIKREYLSRVRKKSFLIATLLVPLAFPALIFLMVYLAVEQRQNAEARVVQVVDETNSMVFGETDRFKFVNVKADLETAKVAFGESDDFALLYIPQVELDNPEGITLYSKENPSITIIEDVEEEIEAGFEDIKLKRSGLSKETLDSLKSNVVVKSINITDTGEEKVSSAGWASGIGYVTGFLIYIFLFAYGAQIMNGVLEEKTSKIVEVIVSTVKPFQLMLGKVLGVAAVGITQVLIWVVLIAVLSTLVFAYFGIDPDQAQKATEVIQEMPNAQNQSPMMDPKIAGLIEQYQAIPFGYIISTFIFYVFGGLLLYGALFAAIGAAVDNQNDAQQFMFPIMLPILIGFFGLFMFVFDDPHSAPSFWLSIIPFTSPIVMMGRVGFEVPLWELLLSMVLLVLGFIFTLWLAGRIYRIGILMHGTKVNYKVLAKWLRTSN